MGVILGRGFVFVIVLFFFLKKNFLLAALEFSIGSGAQRGGCRIWLHSFFLSWTLDGVSFCFMLCGFCLKVALEFRVGEVSHFGCHSHEFCSCMVVG